VVTQEKAKLDAKIKHNDARIAEGRTEELTEFEYKRSEKEKHVIELRERLAKLKEKVSYDFRTHAKLKEKVNLNYEKECSEDPITGRIWLSNCRFRVKPDKL
jgi:hypothetical protein